MGALRLHEAVSSNSSSAHSAQNSATSSSMSKGAPLPPGRVRFCPARDGGAALRKVG